MAACGYTNRDISTRLYITVSTVEQHLTRVYRKLRIEGRQQLPTGLQFEVIESA
ncbi:helix-turn-helix transcriptional regulator [Streptomyces sp. M19]